MVLSAYSSHAQDVLLRSRSTEHKADPAFSQTPWAPHLTDDPVTGSPHNSATFLTDGRKEVQLIYLSRSRKRLAYDLDQGATGLHSEVALLL